MGEKRRLSLQFSPENPRHQKALSYIEAAGSGHYTDAVVNAVCGYLDQRQFCQEVQKTIHAEFQNITLSKPTESQKLYLDDSVVSFLQSL